MSIRPTQLNFAKQVIFAQISKNWLLLEISKSCHFKTVISYWIRQFLLISFQFWQEKPWFLSVRYNPAFVGQYGRKSKFQLRLSNIGLLASYETQNSKYYQINYMVMPLWHKCLTFLWFLPVLILEKVLNLTKTKIDKI